MDDLTRLFEVLYKVVLLPIGGLFWWMFRKYDKRMDDIENRMNVLEREHAVLDTKLDSLKEGLEDIKKQLDKIFTALQTLR